MREVLQQLKKINLENFVGIGLSQNSTIDALWDMAPSPR
jgi:hypothetical protein